MGLTEAEASIDSASSAKKTRIEYCAAAAAAAAPLFSQIQLLFISSSFSFLFPLLPALFLPSVLVLPSPRERGLDLWHVGRGREKGASPSTTTPTSGKRQSFFAALVGGTNTYRSKRRELQGRRENGKGGNFFPVEFLFFPSIVAAAGNSTVLPSFPSPSSAAVKISYLSINFLPPPPLPQSPCKIVLG